MGGARHPSCLIKEVVEGKSGIGQLENSINGFVNLWMNGCGCFYIGQEKSHAFCSLLSNGFEGLEDTTLSGNDGTWDCGLFHHCTRLVAAQLSS